MGRNAEILKKISKPRSPEAVSKAEARRLRRMHNQHDTDPNTGNLDKMVTNTNNMNKKYFKIEVFLKPSPEVRLYGVEGDQDLMLERVYAFTTSQITMWYAISRNAVYALDIMLEHISQLGPSVDKNTLMLTLKTKRDNILREINATNNGKIQ